MTDTEKPATSPGVWSLHQELWIFVANRLRELACSDTTSLCLVLKGLDEKLSAKELKKAWHCWSFNGGDVPALKNGKECCFACAYAEWYALQLGSLSGYSDLCARCPVEWDGKSTGSVSGCVAEGSAYKRFVYYLDASKEVLKKITTFDSRDGQLNKLRNQILKAADIATEIAVLPWSASYQAITVQRLAEELPND